MADFELFLLDPQGERIRVLTNPLSFQYTLVANDVSVAMIALDGLSYNIANFSRNQRIEIERDGHLEGGAPFFIRQKRLQLQDGRYVLTLQALHTNWLLDSRCILYYAGSSQASVSSVPADNLLKDLVYQNLGGGAQHADRDIAAPDLSNFILIEADSSEGASISRGFSRRQMLPTMRDIAQESYNGGTPLFFGFEKTAAGLFEFKTRVNQWGNDIRNNVVISPEFNNLVDADQTWDYLDEMTVAIALGSDTGANRAIATSQAAEATSDVFGWTERTTDARNISTAASLQAEADGYLKQNRARLALGGRIQETQSFRYNLEWGWGDRVLREFAGVRDTAWINKVTVTVRDGREDINAVLEV